MPSPKIIRNSARCRKCGVEVESRHRHDFVWCSCQSIAVDGGHDYMKRTGNIEDIEETSVCDPPMTTTTDPAPASAPEPAKCPKCGVADLSEITDEGCDTEVKIYGCGTEICTNDDCCDAASALCLGIKEERDALRAAVSRLEGELAEAKQVGVGVLGMLDRGIVPEEYEEQFAAIRLMVHAFYEGDAALTHEAAEKALSACSEYRDANQRLTAALAGSVPRAVALRACERFGALSWNRGYDRGHGGPSRLELDEAADIEAALARALREHADRAASAASNDPKETAP